MLNFRDAGIKEKLEPLCMAIINSNENKKIIYNFGNDFCFQNEELSLHKFQLDWRILANVTII